MKFCSNCGANVEESKFCNRCGQATGLTSTPQTPTPRDRSIAIQIVRGLALAVCALFFVGFGLGLLRYTLGDGSAGVQQPDPGVTTSPDRPPAAPRLRSGQTVSVMTASACTPDGDDFPLMARALINQDREALGSLVEQGRVLLLDAGTMAEIWTTGRERTQIQVMGGQHIGRRCELLTAQLRP